MTLDDHKIRSNKEYLETGPSKNNKYKFTTYTIHKIKILEIC